MVVCSPAIYFCFSFVFDLFTFLYLCKSGYPAVSESVIFQDPVCPNANVAGVCFKKKRKCVYIPAYVCDHTVDICQNYLLIIALHQVKS